MLTEFAFTPAIFEEKVHPDVNAWSAQLDRLAERMFPQGYPWPVIVANLYSGGWKSEATKQIQRIKNVNVRTKAMKLFEQIEKVLIERPDHLEWPEDELGWCLEAIESDKRFEPIERIVACLFTMTPHNASLRGVRCLSEVTGSGFWSGIPVDDSPEMDVRVQVKLLRKLCVHAGFISLITPHIKGGGDDESDFAVELCRAAGVRPNGRPGPVFAIHTDGPRNSIVGDPQIISLADAIEDKIFRDLGSGYTLSLTLWPKLLHRYIIAGEMTRDATGQPARRSRWAISMNHVAKLGDERKGLMPADWKLLRLDRVRDLASQFCSTSTKGSLHTRTIIT